MKQIGIVTLLSVIASAAAPVAPRAHGAPLVTAKSVAQFGGCFVGAQDRASLAWSFVPKPHGGTFSNLGAKGARNPYFLAIADRGPTRVVRLDAASANMVVDRRVAQAVNQCI